MTRQIRLMPGKGSGRPLLLAHGPNVIGRSNDCDHQLEAATVSEKHCRIDCSPNSVMIRDLGSTNGTFVNSERVTRTMLDPGDVIKIGAFKFQVTFSDVAPDPVIVETVHRDDGEDFDLSQDVPWMEELQSVEDDVATDFDVESPSEDSNFEFDTAPENQQRKRVVRKSKTTKQQPSSKRVGNQQTSRKTPPPEPVQHTNVASAAVVPTSAQPQPHPTAVPTTAAAPPSVSAVSHPQTAAKAQPAIRTRKEPRIWSGKIDFLLENSKAILTIAAGFLVTVIFLVPWGSFFMPSDLEVCGFYESTLAEIMMLRNEDAAETEWEDLTNRAMSKHNEYFSLLDSPYISNTTRLLVMGGRDNLGNLLKSREKGSSDEVIFRQKVDAARKLVGGSSLVAALESSEAAKKREADHAAVAKAMSGMISE